MLFSKNRLRKKKDFERVLRDKQSRALTVSFLGARMSDNGLAYTRVGFVVSKKVSKKAVVRNKIKRQLREVVRPLVKNFKKGFDIVVFVKPGTRETDFKEIKSTTETLFKKMGIE